ncbi:MAG: hypothetical protein ACUVSL_04170 [Chloroflexus sp.]|uniref:hypothetical protein n=1 Tax=Chloroflexus sp. TaxID=1904827 RepID=UPI00404AE78F
MQITTTGTPTAEEAAAAVAAIMVILTEEAAQPGEQPVTLPTRWRDSMRLIAQGMQPTRVPVPPGWSTIERIRRAGRGGMGIVGM